MQYPSWEEPDNFINHRMPKTNIDIFYFVQTSRRRTRSYGRVWPGGRPNWSRAGRSVKLWGRKMADCRKSWSGAARRTPSCRIRCTPARRSCTGTNTRASCDLKHHRAANEHPQDSLLLSLLHATYSALKFDHLSFGGSYLNTSMWIHNDGMLPLAPDATDTVDWGWHPKPGVQFTVRSLHLPSLSLSVCGSMNTLYINKAYYFCSFWDTEIWTILILVGFFFLLGFYNKV